MGGFSLTSQDKKCPEPVTMHTALCLGSFFQAKFLLLHLNRTDVLFADVFTL